MRKRAVAVTIGHDAEQPAFLGRYDLWLPGRQNQERAELQVPTVWLAEQFCPEHPSTLYQREDGKWVGFRSFRAHWVRVGRLWRTSVMFLCPKGHVWEVVLPEVT